jgi:hypothetical protein
MMPGGSCRVVGLLSLAVTREYQSGAPHCPGTGWIRDCDFEILRAHGRSLDGPLAGRIATDNEY